MGGFVEIAQSAVAKLEHAEGDRVSTLPDYLDAIGARRVAGPPR